MTTRPNVLVFCTDQMQAASMGCAGNPDVRTPHLDALAAQGVRFSRAYCNNPVCSPSRATLATGLTPRQHGLLTNGMGLDPSLPTLPAVLAAAGWTTRAIGKLHLQPFADAGRLPDGAPRSWESRPLWMDGSIRRMPSPYYGFQYTELVGGHVNWCFGDYQHWLTERGGSLRQYAPPAGKGRGETWPLALPARLHYNHYIAERACAFLDTAGDRPFYLFCSFPDPHHPFAAAPEFRALYDPGRLSLPPTWDDPADPTARLALCREVQPEMSAWDEAELREMLAQTYAMVTHVDDAVGRILARLAERGLNDSTLVVFTADHADYLGHHHLVKKSAWPYEAQWRVPFLWRVPGRPACGAVFDEPVSLLDFVPTLLDFCAIPCSSLQQRGGGEGQRPGLPGRSLRRRLLADEPLEDIPALVEYDEDWHRGPMIRLRALVGRRFKLVVYGGTGQGLLFDLESDPHERANRWNDPACAAVKSELLQALVDRLASSDPTGHRVSSA